MKGYVLKSTELVSITPAIALVVIVIGWFINSWLTRRHEIAKRRVEIRLEMLRSFIELSKKLNSQPEKFPANELMDVQVNFLVYGCNDEIELINSLVENLNNKRLTEAGEQLTKLTNLVRSRLRKELGLPKIT